MLLLAIIPFDFWMPLLINYNALDKLLKQKADQLLSIRYIDTKTSEYLQQLSDNDKANDDLDVSHIQAKIQRLKTLKSSMKHWKISSTKVLNLSVGGAMTIPISEV
jgi:hypothetical protein